MDWQAQLEAMTAERDHLLQVLRSMGDAVVCADGAGAITFLNPKAEALTGWRRDDAMGLPIATVLPFSREDDHQTVLHPVQDCRLSGEPQISERGTILTSKDGQRRYVGYSVAPIHSQAGDAAGTVLILNDVTEVRTAEKEIAHSAKHDPLTGLPNRSNFLRSLSKLLDQARESREDTHYLLFVDLDHFKQVNDTGGHAAGDAVLVEVAHILRKVCAEPQAIARLGGDEFAVLLPNSSAYQVEWTANRLIRAIKYTRFSFGGEEFRIGASIGATLINRHAPALSEVLHQADMACYAAKERGRSRLSLYNGRRRTLVASLSSAARAKGM